MDRKGLTRPVFSEKMSQKQKTLATQATLSGVGLHTGKKVTMTLLPAAPGTGFVFVRKDLEGSPTVEADANLVSQTSRGTVLEKKGVKVHTTEHILAALWGADLDNVTIELDGPEPPIMDGSARYFMEAIAQAGVAEQDAERAYYEIDDIIRYYDPETGSELIAMPSEHPAMQVMVDFGSRVLNTQNATWNEKTDFAAEIAPCRTFCFLDEIEGMIKAGLIKGGDLSNAIVYVDKKISDDTLAHLKELFHREDITVNADGVLDNLSLLYPNEAARHKLLDLVGDLALVGRRLRGRIIATKPGHAANTQFARKLAQTIHAQERNPMPKIDLNREPLMDINDIIRVLPHRPPFLLVDKILELSEEHVVGLKNVTMNEPFFVGHFPGAPVMPGVLQIEAMAQCGGILALNAVDDPENYLTYFMKIDNAKFKYQVHPGDTLIFSLKLKEPIRRGICHMEGRAFVGNRLVCEADLMALITRKDKAK